MYRHSIIINIVCIPAACKQDECLLTSRCTTAGVSPWVLCRNERLSAASVRISTRSYMSIRSLSCAPWKQLMLHLVIWLNGHLPSRDVCTETPQPSIHRWSLVAQGQYQHQQFAQVCCAYTCACGYQLHNCTNDCIKSRCGSEIPVNNLYFCMQRVRLLLSCSAVHVELHPSNHLMGVISKTIHSLLPLHSASGP